MRFLQGGNYALARDHCRQVLQLDRKNADALHMLGLIAARTGKHDEAVGFITESLASNASNAGAHNNLGVSLKSLGRLDEAVASYDRAIALKADYADACTNRGNALLELRRAEDALASFQRVIALKSDFAPAHHNMGNALFALARLPEALAMYRRAVALNAGYRDAHNNQGNVLSALHRGEEALACYDTALRIDPDYVEAWTNRGNALLGLKRVEDALRSFEKALSLKPEDDEAWNGLAEALLKSRRSRDAVDAYRRLVEINPTYPSARGNLLHARMLCCDWTDFDALCLSIQHDLRQGLQSAEPFGYQGVAESEQDLALCAEIFAAAEYPAQAGVDVASPTPRDARITIGYLCGEFRRQATTILMCGVYESHDRSSFRLVAFDSGWSDDSDYRRRIERSFDEIVDISGMGDLEAAQAIKGRGVDLLINLNGYFGEQRLGIFAFRPAPVQVNYLGFPGTLGVPYVDYLLADRWVIPEASRPYYAEKVVYLPGSYQANDARREVSEAPVSRADLGLPEDAFVFCCFNNTYKITPVMFGAWMRILGRVEGSVLWLMETHDTASDSLRREAAARGIAPDRLVFARHLAPAEHLARHRVADLFLDTLPYNAHTTASDALWAGLPVVTLTGSTFPGRVGTSLLNAVGLPELVATTLHGYEDLAVELALAPPRLQALRRSLDARKQLAPLFDTALTTRHLEAAYRSMHQRFLAGLPAAHLDVPG